MRLYLVLLLLSCCSLAQAVERAFFREDGSKIEYYLMSENKTKTLLVVLQGSDCNSVYNNQFVRENFTQLVEADVLLVEKYAITNELPYRLDEARSDCPVDYLLNDSVLQRRDDYLHVLAYLKSHYEKIYLLGGSEGAVVAALIAHKADYIDKAVLINGGSRFFLDDILHNLAATVPTEHLAAAQADFIAKVKGLASANSGSLSGHGAKWWRDAMAVDLQHSLEQSQVRLLYIQTTKDENVDWQGALAMSQALTNKNVKFVFIDHQNHFFLDQNGASLVKVVKEMIVDWLAD
ncbi:hypothetical protein VQ643_00670 [Pseudomonas sp. F1_0610]|uniref:alpha/beta hydrolase family protein n=1 Tax=Pseudomonas sp. F1_0610 TaxID=3114284 RepID=UPI0039C43F0C